MDGRSWLSSSVVDSGVLQSPVAHVEFTELGVSRCLRHHGYFKHEGSCRLLPMDVSPLGHLIFEEGQPNGNPIQQCMTFIVIRKIQLLMFK